MKKALKAIIHPVDSLKALVTRPALSASRHVVSDWCSVKNTEDQEGEGRRVRRVRFAANAKKNDGVFDPRRGWIQSSIPREVEDEFRYVSMPSDYQDGNFDDWLHHHQEDLEKRAAFWCYVHKKSLVKKKLWKFIFPDLHILLQQKQQEFWKLEDQIAALDQRASPWYLDFYNGKKSAVEKELYALDQQLREKQQELRLEVEHKIDALFPEVEEEEPEQVHGEVLQENDSIEVEELGSGFATDAAGRVRRFSHRLKGKSRKVYKF